MRRIRAGAVLAVSVALTRAAWGAPSSDKPIVVPQLKPGVVAPAVAQQPAPYQVAQATPPSALAGGFYYDAMTFNPFVYFKTEALTQQLSLARGVWGGTYEYNHFAIGDSFKLVLQYQGQYHHYFSVPSDRAFFHRGALHLMKQFGDYSWHVGGQALFKHPAFNVGVKNLDQLYYTVVERPIGLFGFNLMNVGLTFDYFRSGVVGSSYYAPGLVFGYSPPLGDIMDTGFSYRLQYRIGLDGAPNGLRHIVSFNVAPNFLPVLPVNLNTGIEVQAGQPFTFFFGTGIGFSPTISIQKGVAAPAAPGTGEQPPPDAINRGDLLKTLAIPGLDLSGSLTAAGNSPTDPGSTTGRDINLFVH